MTFEMFFAVMLNVMVGVIMLNGIGLTVMAPNKRLTFEMVGVDDNLLLA